MEFITTKEAAAIWGISPTRVTVLATQGRINGARKAGTSWLIPKNAPKPQDRRVRQDEKPLSAETEDAFSFPFYLCRPDWSAEKEAALSPQERLLLQAQSALLNCRFQEAENYIAALRQKPCTQTIELACLTVEALCCVMQNRPSEYLSAYYRMQQIFTEDFPHKEDLKLLLSLIETYMLPLSTAKDTVFCAETVHFQCIPAVCSLNGYSALSKEIFQAGSVDVNTLELNLRMLENTSAILTIEQMHIYLMGIYALRRETEKARRHADAIATLVYKTRHYLPLTTYVKYFGNIFAPAMNTYPADFVNEFLQVTKRIGQNYPAFLSAISQNSIFHLLNGKYIAYIKEILMDSSNKVIAAHLGVSEQTVVRKLNELYGALHVESKKELREYILRNL